MITIEPTVDSVGDAALTNSIIDCSILELQDVILKNLPARAMLGLKSLKKAAFGSVTQVGKYAFNGCTALEEVVFASAVTLYEYAFQNCTSLKKVDFGEKVSFKTSSSSNYYTFHLCSKLDTVILRSQTLCSLPNANVFKNGTPIDSKTGYIYVPSSLVDTYKISSVWKNYASQIRAIEDYPEICDP